MTTLSGPRLKDPPPPIRDASDAREARAAIPWRDLVPLRTWEIAWELTLSLPWLLGSWWCYQHIQSGPWGGLAWLALACGAIGSFFFFLTGLRQSHNAQHYALGLPRPVQDAVLCILSLLMFSSMHAVQVTHLHHHRHCLDEQDIEAGHANDRWWRVLLLGPLHPLRLHRAALRLGSRDKRLWIATELLLIAITTAALFALPVWTFLQWHATAMIVGECFTGFFAVWTVHHGCDEHTIARTQRGWLKNFLSYSMFYHLEHHLFPAVPTGHLPLLAERLDKVLPEARERQVM